MTGRRARPPGAAATGHRLALAAWTALVCGSVLALHAIGGPLAPPPLSDPGAVGPWLDARLPAEAAVALVRLVALTLAWYLLTATVASAVARLSGAAAAVRVSDAFSVPLVRRVVHGAVGLSLAAGAGPVAESAHAAPLPAVTAERAVPGRATTSPPPTMRLLPPPDPAAPPPLPPGRDADTATAAGAGAWTVRPGDHLWAVAEHVLAGAWDRPPTDAEVDPYWRAVVDANRFRLRDPANADLVFPGQALVLPPPPPDTARDPLAPDSPRTPGRTG